MWEGGASANGGRRAWHRQDRWYVLSEMPAAVGDSLGSLMRIRALDGSAPIGDWGEEGVVDLTFVGPLNEGGSLDARTEMPEGLKSLGLLLVSGAALTVAAPTRNCPRCPSSVRDGSYHPDFGQEGRIVLDPDGWQVEDSVRHEFSGRFSEALFVPWNPYESDPNDLDNIRILAGGTYALAGAFRPFLAMFRWTEPSSRIRRGRHPVLVRGRQPEPRGARSAPPLGMARARCRRAHSPRDARGRAHLAAGTMSAGWVPLWPEASAGSPTTSINPGLMTNDPVRSVALAAGFGWKLEDETVVVGTRDIGPGWDGEAHPVWWTGPHMAFGGVNAYWTEDVEFPSQRVGALSAGNPVVHRRHPARGQPGLEFPIRPAGRRMFRGTSLQAESAGPFPFPTSGVVEWPCAPGTIQCRDDRGRLLGEWRHPRGRFRLDLPRVRRGSGLGARVASGPTAGLTRRKPGFNVDKPERIPAVPGRVAAKFVPRFPTP